MISESLISKAKEQAYVDSNTYGAPSIFQIDYSVEIGQKVADKVGANKKIVLLGTCFMDCMLGYAYSLNRLPEHIKMSHDKAKEILISDKDITKEETDNVLNCVLEHHGSKSFYSLESEVVCNADCYKFSSVKGVIGGIKYMRDMPIDSLVKLFNDKADEKWSALSLKYCKDELKEQYRLIKEFLGSYKSS